MNKLIKSCKIATVEGGRAFIIDDRNLTATRNNPLKLVMSKKLIELVIILLTEKVNVQVDFLSALNKKNLKILFLSFLFCNHFFAQHELKGKITDDEGFPFQFCKLVLKKDSVILGIKFTDSLGLYTFNDINVDSVNLTIISPFVKIDTLLSISNKSNFDLKIKYGQDIGELVVTSKRQTIIRKVDRVIFNPANIPLLAGGSAVDVLEFAPGIYIQGSSIMTSTGKTCQILINEKIIPLQGDDLISFIFAIPTEDIQFIEIMNVVPVKYAANISGALVHIKLKAGAKSLVSNGSLRNSIRQGVYTSDNFGLSYSYRKNKFSLYSTLSGSIYNYGYSNIKEINYPQNVWDEKILQKLNFENYTGGLGLNYEIGKKTEIGLLYVANYEMGKDKIHGNTNFFKPNNTLIFKNDNQSNANYDGLLSSTSFNITHTFDTLMKQVNFIVDLSSKGRNDNLLFSNLYQTNSIDSISSRKSITINKAIFISSGLDFTLPFKKLKLTTGARVSHALNNNDFNVFNLLNSPTVSDTSQSNSFIYAENILATYFSLGKEYKKWSFQFGGRIEYTQTSGNQLSTNEKTNYKYIQFNPQFFAMYKQSDEMYWNFNYNRSFVRPNFNELNPFKIYNSAFSYFQGNSNLKPSYLHIVSINNTYKNLSSGILVMYGNELTSEIVLNDSITYIQRKTVSNYIKFFATGFTLSYSLINLKRWNTKIILNSMYTVVKSNTPSISFQQIENLSFVLIGNTTYTLDKKKTFFIDLSILYNSPWVQNIETLSNNPHVSIELKKTFYNNRFGTSICISDPFRIEKEKSRFTTNGVTTNSKGYFDTQCIYVELNYNFGNRNVTVNEKNAGSTGESGRYKTD